MQGAFDLIKKSIDKFSGKRVLLLQGPIGPFFRRLSKDLSSAGAKVFKVNFNGGDWLYYPTGAVNYKGRMEDWPRYLEEILERFNIDVLILFGDCRPIHRVAHGIASKRGLEIGVFEEGYIRPNYVTFESFGVNGFSLISQTPQCYMNNPAQDAGPPLPVGKTFYAAAFWTCLYYIAASLLKPLFRHYVHHRPLTLIEGFPWLRSLWRKMYYAFAQRGIITSLTGEFSKRYFLFPLQTNCDSQIKVHSDFPSMQHFIGCVIKSFANHAPENNILVIKHHPMDRGYFDYSSLIQELAIKHGLQGRCVYIHDQHLPALIKHSAGVVVVNSTVGLSALNHRVAVIVCGNAIYDIEGITFQGQLDDFWGKASQSRPDPEMFKCFRNQLIQNTQLNGSFYTRLPITGTHTGMPWAQKQVSGQKTDKI